MSVSQQGDPHVSDRSGRNNSTESSSSEGRCTVGFEDVNSPFQTILLVDDEPDILESRRLLFEAFGFSVFTADSGEKALYLLQVNKIDAVVLDYMMPGMDGEQTARRIRGAHGNIPIILSSGCFSLPQSVLRIVNASVDKLAGPETLLEVLEQRLHTAADREDILID